jgi:hypothetical protein
MYGVVIGDDFGCSRDELRTGLAQRGIETRTFFIPIHLQPIYFARFRGERYPVAECSARAGSTSLGCFTDFFRNRLHRDGDSRDMRIKLKNDADKTTRPRAVLTPRGMERAQSGHLWIYRSDVAEVDSASTGDVVQVKIDAKNSWVGTLRRRVGDNPALSQYERR